MNARHEVEWTPPPHLDTGQTRINTYHRPEVLLRPPHDDEPAGPAEPADDPDAAQKTEPTGEAEVCPPTSPDDPGQPGGPAPPGDQAA